MPIKLIPRDASSGATHDVQFASNGVALGEIYMEVDGYYVFEPGRDSNGFWEAYVLRAIADKLDEMNKAWDAEVTEMLSRVKPT